ncbi:MAG: hypothetical protein PHE54_01080 [Bacilli bacterium]|nr:hypothetical protein [Bacilli bacterium]
MDRAKWLKLRTFVGTLLLAGSLNSREHAMENNGNSVIEGVQQSYYNNIFDIDIYKSY